MARQPKIRKHGSGNQLDLRDKVSTSAPVEEEKYKVGPGRPPKEHQFKRGQSGNPKGRKPKESSLIHDLKEQFERIASQKIKVTQGERQRFITTWVAGMQQLFVQFAKGDRHARRDVFWVAERLGVDLLKPSMASEEALSADYRAILEAYVQRRMQEKDLSASTAVLAPPELLDDADEADQK